MHRDGQASPYTSAPASLGYLADWPYIHALRTYAVPISAHLCRYLWAGGTRGVCRAASRALQSTRTVCIESFQTCDLHTRTLQSTPHSSLATRGHDPPPKSGTPISVATPMRVARRPTPPRSLDSHPPPHSHRPPLSSSSTLILHSLVRPHRACPQLQMLTRPGSGRPHCPLSSTCRASTATGAPISSVGGQ